MDYKEIYKEALERASKLRVQNPFDTVGQMVEYIFPELKRAEDERIKFLIKSCVYASDITPEGREEIFAWLEKQSEKKPTDKVEPKFKVGDWIVNKLGDLWHIDSFDKKNYQVSNKKGNHNYFPISKQDEMRHWAIQDAEDGDVLVDENDNIGLYSGEKDDLYWHSCVYLGCDGFIHGGFGVRGYHKHNNTKPATVEQRDLLFSKMEQERWL